MVFTAGSMQSRDCATQSGNSRLCDNPHVILDCTDP